MFIRIHGAGFRRHHKSRDLRPVHSVSVHDSHASAETFMSHHKIFHCTSEQHHISSGGLVTELWIVIVRQRT